jgi:hypothetical protein
MDPWTASVIRATLPASVALIITGSILHFAGDVRGRWLLIGGTLGLLALAITDNLGASYELLWEQGRRAVGAGPSAPP